MNELVNFGGQISQLYNVLYQMTINSPVEMFELGKNLAQKYKKILLIGELGAGKTTFSKGFAAGLGVDSNQVQSPTYTYMHAYDQKLLHIDMYRIEDLDQLLQLGLLDQIENYEYILIERPKWTEQYRDANWLSVEIEKDGDNKRIITLS